MADQLLSAIIALEKDLQEQIQKEQSRALAWREQQLAALAADRERQHTALAATRSAEIEAVRQAAVGEGAHALAAARAWCARLEQLPDEVCIRHLAALLQRLLPEAGDDHPHGQN